MLSRIRISSRKWAVYLLWSSLVVVGSTAHASDSKSEEKFKAAIQQYNQANFDMSLSLLEEAEYMAKDKAQLSQILNQRGIILDVIGERLDALLAFVRAITVNSGMELETHKVRSSAIRLFRCAGVFVKTGLPITEIREQHGQQIEADNWKCPVSENSVKEVTSVKSEKPSPSPKPELPKLQGKDSAPNPASSSPVLVSNKIDEQGAERLAWRWGFIGAGLLGLVGGIALDYTNELGDNYSFDPEDLTGTVVGTVGLSAIVTGIFFNPYAHSPK